MTNFADHMTLFSIPKWRVFFFVKKMESYEHNNFCQYYIKVNSKVTLVVSCEQWYYVFCKRRVYDYCKTDELYNTKYRYDFVYLKSLAVF